MARYADNYVGLSCQVFVSNVGYTIGGEIEVFVNFLQIFLTVCNLHYTITTERERRKLPHKRHTDTLRLHCLATLLQCSPGLFAPVPSQFCCFSDSVVVSAAAASRLRPAVRKIKIQILAT